MRIILAGGGTGGHLFPGVAIAEELKERRPDSEILFVINKGLSEPTTITCSGFPFRKIAAGKWRGKSPCKLLLAVLHLTVGFFQSLLIIRRFKPDVVVGLGGYASCPLMFAGIVCGKTTIIHEQNYNPGLANRLLSRIVDEVEVSFPETKIAKVQPCNVCVTGNPIRRSILTADRLRGIKSLGLGEGKLNLVIFGGSQGAHRINLAALSALREIKGMSDILAAWQVVHITGRKDYSVMVDAYESSGIEAHVLPFVERMENIYGIADVIVCRAGGSTVAELTAIGLPAVYVPYPWAADNHQEYNARYVCEKGAGVLVPDSELENTFRDVLVDLMQDREKREKMSSASRKLGRPSASAKVVERIICLKE